jgi:hypothetical protein
MGAAGLLAAPAMAAPDGLSAGARHAAARQPWVAIMSVTPGYAQPTGKVIVSGIVVNPSDTPLRSASIQILSAQNPLNSQQMAGYLTAAQPSPGVDLAILKADTSLPTPVPAHGTEQWKVPLTAQQVGMTTFGVYPLTAQLTVTDPVLGTGTPEDWASTFLPFWPGKSAARKKASIAWVWPLIDIPQQTVCGTVATNELAGSVAGGGRLNLLLAAGQTPAGQQAQLTWAIDPALLSDVSAMSRPHRVTGTGGCSSGKLEPASSAAKAWLTGVQQATAHQDYFTTPYADVDVAALALSHSGLYGELAAAFADGGAAATQTEVPGTTKKVLGQPQRVTPDTAGRIAWPAGGIASYGVLETLAAQDKIGTAILSSSLIHTPDTVTGVPNGQGGVLNVLLASSTLTKILSTGRDAIPGLVPDGGTTPPGARADARAAATFAKQQWFLAETAMIAATAPAAGRAVVVAPPRRWSPPPDLADALLTDTVSTPWLQPTTLAGLASTHTQTGQNPNIPEGKQVTRGELGGPLLNLVRHLSQQVQLLDSILPKSARGYLSTAVDTAESSAWRGGRGKQHHAERLVRRDLAYVEGRLRQVKIVGHLQVTLGGQNGVVPVSVSNDLSQPVTVKLVASAPPEDHVTIGKSTNVFTDVITVAAHTQRIIKISVTAAQAGPTVITLRLETPHGYTLPVHSSTLTVVATHFGTLAIVIISIALAVFLVTATARAIRGRPQDDGSESEAEELDPMPSTREPASADGETDSVVSRGADDRQPAKEADEHAATPGTADRS